MAQKFLNYAGLEKFWGIITGKFATKTDAAKAGSFVYSADATSATLNYQNVAGEGQTAINITGATSEKAGLMSAADFNTLKGLSTTIDNAQKVTNIQIAGKDILNNKVANFGLEYEVDDTQAFISLVDASVAKGTEGRAISRIDVSALVKTGLLSGVELVVNPSGQNAGTYIKMTFNTVSATKDVYINVTDLIDVYTAADKGGIEISNATSSGVDGAATARTIAVKTASATEKGAILIGYTAATGTKNYAVELDADGRAFVNVPWVDVTGSATGDDYISATTTTVDGVVSTTIKATEKLTGAVTKAESALQTASGETDAAALVTAAKEGVNVKVASTAKLQTAVGLAETALQSVANGQGVVVTKGDDNKTVTVSLDATTVTSLGKADTAMQDIMILGRTLDKDNKTLTTEDAKTILGLKSAAYVATTDAVEKAGDDTNAGNLPTAAAVKSYVDSKATSDLTNLETKLNTAITTAIGGLDSSKTYGKTTANAETGKTGQMFFTKVDIVDGKLTENCAAAAVTVDDIVDLIALTDDEIVAICK